MKNRKDNYADDSSSEKEEYETPSFLIIKIEQEDIITVSNVISEDDISKWGM